MGEPIWDDEGVAQDVIDCNDFLEMNIWSSGIYG
jgi:hypothetical protein